MDDERVDIPSRWETLCKVCVRTATKVLHRRILVSSENITLSINVTRSAPF